MTPSEEELTQQTAALINLLGDTISWRYEERLNVMLSEFAQNKGAPIFTVLQSHFSDEWDVKTIKYAPPELLTELADLAMLTKKQILFTLPSSDASPAMVAMWWPWGHGGTYSLRLKTLSNSYDINNKTQPLFTKIKHFFSK